MRAALVLLIAMSSVASADDRVVVMTNDNLASALEIALAGRHVGVATAPSPTGALRLDRAAAAQHAAMSAEAGASVWIDAGDVCVVSSDGVYFRQAPLPYSTTPRVFAAIAVSLLDELIAPPEQASFEPRPPVQIIESPSSTTTLTTTAMPIQIDPARWKHTQLEIGPTLSPASYGMEIELSFPVLPNLRVGVLGGISQLFDGIADDIPGTRLYDAAMEVRYVGAGVTHFDVGLAGGVLNGTDMSEEPDTGGFAAVRLSYTREYAATAISFSVAPMLMFDMRGHDNTFGVMSSLRLVVPI